ncbi:MULTISPECIES: DsrE family protein [unclassified Bradyrhizobium]|uniref:DsrE family protein n=1 Tax=unclassified Bradyrhizobium TaxID=2631580 RepID=UPI001BAD13E5|nr:MULTISPECIES: DsrE family protein [unclassified Bradyrhizobium]MBR1229055.1 DsrE family protein [Bradyrhizobium sp. AUGA SZCCT0176]MBR1299010.1 DsrE family protein [Bradyrhizobium sp. AUGA SZCCT0042]
MSMFQYIARVITMAAATVLFAAPFAAAEQGGRYWVPTTTEPATHHQRIAAKATTPNKATTQKRARSPLAANARLASDSKAHRLILQVNTNDPAAMNLALNNATNVAQYYKDAGEKVKIEVVTFGPGLHMLRDDTSPVKARIEEMALSTPEVSFKACGNTQERMHKAENKDIPIVRQAEVVKSGVVRVMELQEKGWSYVKP